MKHEHSQFAPVQTCVQAYSSPQEVEDRVRRFIPMVQRAAWHIFGMGRDGMEVEDLVQAGMIALTEAAQRHSGPTEDGFAAYAKMRARGAMFDLVRKTMPVSRSAAQSRKRYDAAVDVLQGRLGRAPVAREIAGHLGCSLEELHAIEASGVQINSIDDSYDENDTAFASTVPDPFEALAALDDRDRLVEAMGELPQRLQLVLQLFFVKELNLTEIAAVLEVSVPRVHQLRGQALAKLKALLAPD